MAKLIYEDSIGSNLLNPENYPTEVKNYLEEEKMHVTKSIKSSGKRLLMEIGCFDATYLRWCYKNNIKYVGLDIVEKYIAEGKRRANFFGISENGYELIRFDACDLISIAEKSILFNQFNKAEVLILFPFNCLGNIQEVDRVIQCLHSLKIDFIISNFNTNDFTNSVRLIYYENCGYTLLAMNKENNGVRFTSFEGLDTIAFEQDWLTAKFGIQIQRSVSVGSVGTVYEKFDY